MQTLTETVWKLAPPGGLFDETVVATCFPEASAAARRNLVHRATRAGEVQIVRRGLYVLAPPFRGKALDPVVLVPMIYGPSYVSFESALRFFGLIPDVVHSIGAATARRSRVFETPMGLYEYTSVPVRTLLAGVQTVSFDLGDRTVSGFMASPARALADLAFIRRDIDWPAEGLRFLDESLRIDPDDLVASLRIADIEATQQAFRTARVRAFLEKLKPLCARAGRQAGREEDRRHEHHRAKTP